ncbi:MAG TPA: hypothetical protein VGQ76_18165 [Thermoanaerobaculia bacterium]|jgi:hypothetical protein|nr:hypothetical protein [Thermoanaerobaculia bacterium]
MTRILLQTTIPHIENDWHIGRFSLLTNLLASMDGVEVTARDRTANSEGNDPVLSTLGSADYDQLWLFGVDSGEGITTGDCEGITAFVQRGGAVLSTRDHDDCGSSICNLGGIGAAHFFHSRNVSPDPSRRVRDDRENTGIDWPNYHSGSNGDYQHIAASGEVHPLLRRADGSTLEWFPAHPHEGEVGVPSDESNARVIAAGTSQTTSRPFNLIVALDATSDRGRGLAHSSIHHFLDYNWDISAGCPSFLEEAPGDELTRFPERLNDIRTYMQNAVRWLSR